jgi:transcriptional regulator with XRE-family HTH domain
VVHNGSPNARRGAAGVHDVRVVDVGTLLRAARERAALTQGDLASAAGTSRSAVTAYERGHMSPTVRTLDRLLAGCGLQARVTLEPLLADLDLRVDALVSGPSSLDVERLAELALSLDDAPEARKLGIGAPPARRGPVRWAFDGGTALGLHGFGAGGATTGLVAVADDALRFWMRAAQVSGETPRGDLYMAWLDADVDTMTAALRHPCFSLLGMLEIRVVDELPATVRIVAPERAPDRHPAWPVVTVDEVEAAHPALAEVLARWRQRGREGRSLGS